MAITATMTPNPLEYIRKTLNLKTLVHLYLRPLNCLNITYTITLIISSGLKDLNFLILPKISSIDSIEKIMIFVNSVEKDIALGIYLQILLPETLKDRGNDIIKYFSSVLKTKTKTDWLETFLNSNIRIIICMDTAGIVVYIPDIKRVI